MFWRKFVVMELTNANIKLISSLDRAKTRRETGLFKAEGTKAVRELMGAFELEALFVTDAWLMENPWAELDATMVRPRDLERMSSLTTPQGVLAVLKAPPIPPLRGGATLALGSHDEAPNNTTNLVPPPLGGRAGGADLLLSLDTIQDPGNLGTIIRTADWFGVTTILASHDTADCFAPKVVQATMGALARVRVIYCDLADELKKAARAGTAVMGTFLGGESIFAADLPAGGILVIGNEGRGISDAVASTVTRRLTIPSYPPDRPTSESLNAAIATAIALAAFRRPLTK